MKVRALVIALAILAAGAHADELAKTVDRVAQAAIESHHTAGLGIAIDQGGTILLNKGYGYADVEKKVPATPDTIYRIGSVTKQFTAVAILQLEAAGKLSLDDPITKILKGYPTPKTPITIKNLLQHTSGIPDFTRDPAHRPNAYKDLTHEEMIARFDQRPLDWTPGLRFGYSNSGYYLLGMIIEEVGGETYADYMATHVLAPAGMAHSRYEAPDGSGRAEGYRPGESGLVVADSISMTQPFAAGALVSTTGDLIAWQRTLVDKRTRPGDAFERMTTDVVRAGKNGETYGYGIRVIERDGHKFIQHGGGIEGFTALLTYYPESDCTVAIIANTEGFRITDLLQGIAEALPKKSDQ